MPTNPTPRKNYTLADITAQSYELACLMLIAAYNEYRTNPNHPFHTKQTRPQTFDPYA